MPERGSIDRFEAGKTYCHSHDLPALESFRFEPLATDNEIRAASLQFVRKVSGSTKPSKANEVAFERAVEDVESVVRQLLDALVTSSPHKDREVEAAKARAKAVQRFGG